MATILVVDDDRSVVHLIENAFRGQAEIEVVAASSAQQGVEQQKRTPADVVLLDVMLPDMSGLDVYQQIRAIDGKLPVIFITVDDTSATAIEAMKRGAFDYLVKPLDLAMVRELVGKALEMRRLMHVPVNLQAQGEIKADGEALVGRTPQMLEVYKAVGRVAPQHVTVLIRGESGTGKELVARAIYHYSQRAKGPFLAVNCAALTETLLESELFGHEKGSFTGATSQRIGKFEQCNGGTIFLDEVGDMSPVMQSKVLRVLQEQRFERVGGTSTIQTDLRIIAATNRNLDQMVAKGEFREDLFYRLNGFTIRLPALRERKDDVLALLEWFLARFRNELRKDVHGISPEALEMLIQYSWPGNVRQLQSVLKQAMVQATGPVLIAEFFPPELHTAEANKSLAADDVEGRLPLEKLVEERLRAGSREIYAEALEAMERTLLTMVLSQTAGNQSRAAEALGITRGSLRNKIRSLGITIGRTIHLDEEKEETEAVAVS
ncbi:MAG: sigma-54-dependent Fis family transcriptional regulator [Pirellulales bacterium]|nr:sigma-54-dependent Fis family transcriptional regulator [Pirellulales bacterium]